MRIAIVGASKLSENEERDAEQYVNYMLDQRISQSLTGDITVVSGGAKGIDSIAERIAKQKGLKTQIFEPEIQQWEDKEGKTGFRYRNLKIAGDCDVLYCIPIALRDKRCYHCDADHQVGGGCWTMWQARKLGKETHLIPPIKR